MLITLTQEQLGERFTRAAFTGEQSTVLSDIVNEIRHVDRERAEDTRELKQGLAALSEEVRELAAAQRRTDSSVRQLAEALQRTDERLARFQERTDERFAALAEALQRTDERLARFQEHTDERFAALAEAQRRTDERLARFQERTDERFAALAEAQQRVEESLGELRVAVGSLANRFGFDLEEFVAALLPPYLERQHDIAGLTLERRYFDMGGGRLEEVDLVGDGTRDGQPVVVLAECRTTVGGSELRRIAEKLREIESQVPAPEVVPVVVAMNVHPTAVDAAAEEGVLVVPYSRINRER